MKTPFLKWPMLILVLFIAGAIGIVILFVHMQSRVVDEVLDRHLCLIEKFDAHEILSSCNSADSRHLLIKDKTDGRYYLIMKLDLREDAHADTHK